MIETFEGLKLRCAINRLPSMFSQRFFNCRIEAVLYLYVARDNFPTNSNACITPRAFSRPKLMIWYLSKVQSPHGDSWSIVITFKTLIANFHRTFAAVMINLILSSSRCIIFYALQHNKTSPSIKSIASLRLYVLKNRPPMWNKVPCFPRSSYSC
jgi:hypothetical protein